MVLVFLSIMNYLIDAYTIFAASCLAGNAVLRSTFGAAFPLFTTQMYDKLGIHWASTIPAFLALACVPFPFLFYKYGAAVRDRCHFSKESELFLKRIRGELDDEDDKEQDVRQQSRPGSSVSDDAIDKDKEMESSNDISSFPRLEEIHTGKSAKTIKEEPWDENPFNIDRVHTKESFKNERARSRARSHARSHASRASSSRQRD
jgi:hypothetical protein